jgi:peptidoglycan/LPS O-acetylase OafA/YrhL
LDGWRALAILAVIVAHDSLHRFGWLSTRWFADVGGDRGVNIFFALSGLLICSRLLQEERVRGVMSLKAFYIRRVCRIQPAALVYLGVIALLMLGNVLDRNNSGLLAALLMVRNFFSIDGGDHSWYTAHFWSLSVEEHFYIFLPTFLVLVRRFRALILGLLTLAVELWRTVGVGLHFSFQSHAFEGRTDLASGPIILSTCVAVLLTRQSFRSWCVRWIRPWVAIVITAVIWTGTAVHNSRASHVLLTVTFPLLIVSTMLHPRSLLGRVLETAPLRFIGRLSYSLYLWQMLFFVHHFHLKPPDEKILVYIQDTPLRYAVLLAVAIASYYCIERPMISLGHRWATPVTPGHEDLEPNAELVHTTPASGR